jgi:hypothetical protein
MAPVHYQVALAAARMVAIQGFLQLSLEVLLDAHLKFSL